MLLEKLTKIAIVGSRKINDVEFVLSKFNEVLRSEKLSYDDVMIISGGARGVDTIAQQIAKKFGLPIIIFYPNWKKYGKRAGLIRNTYIVQYSDIVMAFPSKDSRGTWDTIRKAKENNKKLYVFEYQCHHIPH